MSQFKEISAKQLGNVFELIGDKWMLVSAKNDEKINMMTASWGGLGVMWFKNIAVTVIRPSRYTYEFVQNSDMFALSFFLDGHRDELKLCGSKSGRDIDKVEATGLTPIVDGDAVYFEQADLVLICKKLYAQPMDKQYFSDEQFAQSCYPDGQEHTAFIGEIVKVLSK